MLETTSVAVGTVLLVEDDESAISAARDFIEKLPERPSLLLARTLHELEGQVRAHSGAIDAIVLEVTLPENPGAPEKSAIERIQALRALIPGVPCIAVTADAPDHEAISALRAGLQDYVKKPFTWGFMWHVVGDKVLQSRRERSQAAFQKAVRNIAQHLAHLQTLTAPAVQGTLAREILGVAALAVHADAGWIFLSNDGKSLRCAHAVGAAPISDDKMEKGLFAEVARTKMERCVRIACEEDQAELAEFERNRSALLVIPLIVGKRLLGVVELVRAKDRPPFGSEQVSLMTQFARLAALILEARAREARTSSVLLRGLESAVAGLEGHADRPHQETAAKLQEAVDEARQSVTAVAAAGEQAADELVTLVNRLRERGGPHLAFWKSALQRYVNDVIGEGARL
ncbi:MAG: response regulator [Armatimonadetes bacterium]|nr:response regulator [Armatimonadota bacterium]